MKLKKKRTPFLLPPTVGECVMLAVTNGLPMDEGRKFWAHYEANGWMVGKLPMVGILSAVVNWKRKWVKAQAEEAKLKIKE